MKCNILELAHLSDGPCVIEGRLNYKRVSNGGYRHQNVFKERWFRLINNHLFYFKISEMGKFDTKNPAGVFVMENSSVEMEHGQSIPFSFSISFIDESEKRHLFAARSEDNVVQWVMKLRTCSYEYLRGRLYALQSKIYSITGKDPLLLVPRNKGAKLWAPSQPFSAVPACTVGTPSFSCHLHTNGAFTLERSKSDVQTHHSLKDKSKTTFYVDDDRHETTKKEDHGFALERSKTVTSHDRINPFNGIFDNRPVYSRSAPSPPVRKKLSPASRRIETAVDTTLFTQQGKNLAQVGILDVVPVPPRRKLSPRPDVSNVDNDSKSNDVDDLIKF